MTRRPWRGARSEVIWRPMRGTQTMLTRRPGRGGQGYVSTRCPRGGARTVMPRRTQRGKGSVMTRRPLVPGVGPGVVRRWRHGTQTVLTRRPGRSGRGYVSTRCPGGGARTVMPRRIGRRGAGSLMTRRPRLGGYATVVGRHDDTSCASLPGGARCSRKDLHLPIPVRGTYQRGMGERQRPRGQTYPLTPSLKGRGWSVAASVSLTLGLGGSDIGHREHRVRAGPPMVPPRCRGTGR